MMEMSTAHAPASAKRLDDYRKTQAEDRICSTVIQYCRNGWPETRVGADLKAYWKARGELTLGSNNMWVYRVKTEAKSRSLKLR